MARPAEGVAIASGADLFALLAEYEHEQVSFYYDPTSGYRGIIAIHDTRLGPALGGTRYWKYHDDRAALVDALRLSRGMTYKAAVAGLNLGGGKSVIIGDNRSTRREPVFRAHGRHVESLGGRYITAEDVGTSTADMEFIRAETEHVTGLLGESGDPSPVTAYGVDCGMKACAKVRYGSDSLGGKTIAVQGVGHVGYFLCKLLFEEGAKLLVTDIDPQRIKVVTQDFKAIAVQPDEIYTRQADVFAPQQHSLRAVATEYDLVAAHEGSAGHAFGAAEPEHFGPRRRTLGRGRVVGIEDRGILLDLVLEDPAFRARILLERGVPV